MRKNLTNITSLLFATIVWTDSMAKDFSPRLIAEYSKNCSGISLNKYALKLSSEFRSQTTPQLDTVVTVTNGIFVGQPVLPLPTVPGIKVGNVRRALSPDTSEVILKLDGKSYKVIAAQGDSALLIKDSTGKTIIDRKYVQGKFLIDFSNYDIRWAGDINGDGELDVVAYWWGEESSGYEIWISSAEVPNKYVMCSTTDPNRL